MADINLLPERYKTGIGEREKLLCLIIGGIFILCAVSFYTYGFYKVKALKEEIKKEEIAYALLAETVERQEAMEKLQTVLQAKNDILIAQTKKSLSFYAVIVHLGTLHADGVELEQAVLDRDGLHLKGRAADYSHVMKFMEKCKEDPFFHNVNLVNVRAVDKQELFSTFEAIVNFKERSD